MPIFGMRNGKAPRSSSSWIPQAGSHCIFRSISIFWWGFPNSQAGSWHKSFTFCQVTYVQSLTPFWKCDLAVRFRKSQLSKCLKRNSHKNFHLLLSPATKCLCISPGMSWSNFSVTIIINWCPCLRVNTEATNCSNPDLARWSRRKRSHNKVIPTNPGTWNEMSLENWPAVFFNYRHLIIAQLQSRSFKQDCNCHPPNHHLSKQILQDWSWNCITIQAQNLEDCEQR